MHNGGDKQINRLLSLLREHETVIISEPQKDAHIYTKAYLISSFVPHETLHKLA